MKTLTVSDTAMHALEKLARQLEFKQPGDVFRVALALAHVLAESHAIGATKMILAGDGVLAEVDIAEALSGKPYIVQNLASDG